MGSSSGLVRTLLLAALSLIACTKNEAANAEPAKSAPAVANMPPQAAPMIALLEAVRAGDATKFRNAYSKRIRDDEAQNDWAKNLGEARENLAKAFGEWRIEDFSFAYAGDDERGKLTISHPKQKPIEIAVLREGADWKLDER